MLVLIGITETKAGKERPRDPETDVQKHIRNNQTVIMDDVAKWLVNKLQVREYR